MSKDIGDIFKKFSIAASKIYWPIFDEDLELKFETFTRAKAEVFLIRYFKPDLARWIANRIPNKLLGLWMP